MFHLRCACLLKSNLQVLLFSHVSSLSAWSSVKLVCFSQVCRLSASVSRFSTSFKFQGCSLYSVDLIHFSQSVNLVRFSQVSSFSTSVKCRACPLQLSVKLVRSIKSLACPLSVSIKCQACPLQLGIELVLFTKMSRLSTEVKSQEYPLQSRVEVVRFSQVSKWSASVKF